jgi:hypothetical protein
MMEDSSMPHMRSQHYQTRQQNKCASLMESDAQHSPGGVEGKA